MIYEFEHIFTFLVLTFAARYKANSDQKGATPQTLALRSETD